MFYIIYQVTNNINGKKYIGAHQTSNLNDGYLGSGVGIKRAIKKYGKDNFTKEILHHCKSVEEMYIIETTLVSDEIVNDPNYYNMNVGGKGGFHYINSIPRENPMHDPCNVEKLRNSLLETRNKNRDYYDDISCKNLKLATKSNIGRKHSDETINKRVESIREYYKDNDHVLKGTTMDESHKENIKKSWTEERRNQQADRMRERVANGLDMGQYTRGKKLSNETKEKMSVAAKNRVKRIVVCPHCNKEGGERGMKVWHFDHCKHKNGDI